MLGCCLGVYVGGWLSYEMQSHMLCADLPHTGMQQLKPKLTER
jgi:hypothetical protein